MNRYLGKGYYQLYLSKLNGIPHPFKTTNELSSDIHLELQGKLISSILCMGTTNVRKD